MVDIFKSARFYIWGYVILSTYATCSLYNISWIYDGVFIFFSLSFLASSAFVHNDIVDRSVDRNNNLRKLTNLSGYDIKIAYLFIIFTSFLAFFISYLISAKMLFVTMVIALLLFSYNLFFRRKFLIANLISVITSLSPMWIIPILYDVNFERIYVLMLSAFILLLAREWIFDVEDVKGDILGGRKTMPSVLGARNTLIFAYSLILISYMVVFFWLFMQFDSIELILFIFLSLVFMAIYYIQKDYDKNRKNYFIKPVIKFTYLLMISPFLIIIALG